MKKGLVHIYTGEGKGKTTAALGLSLRAFGCGYKICFLQFFKDRGFPCGEANSLKQLGKNFKFRRFDITHPCFKKIDSAILKSKLKKALSEAEKTIKNEKYDMVILDEILIGVRQGFVVESFILELIKNKPEGVELVLTGRGATKKLIDHADYVTYMRDVRHPFKRGVKARRGVEF